MTFQFLTSSGVPALCGEVIELQEKRQPAAFEHSRELELVRH